MNNIQSLPVQTTYLGPDPILPAIVTAYQLLLLWVDNAHMPFLPMLQTHGNRVPTKHQILMQKESMSQTNFGVEKPLYSIIMHSDWLKIVM